MFTDNQSLKFRLRGIRPGIHTIDLTIPASALEIPEVTTPIRVSGELEASDIYVFRLHLHSVQHFICDRCTTEFDVVVDPDLEVIYAPTDHEAEFEDSGYLHTFDPMTLYEVDLTEDVHDALMLAVPMKRLCKADCPGLPLSEEHAPQFDQRFASLGGLYEKLKSEEGQ